MLQRGVFLKTMIIEIDGNFYRIRYRDSGVLRPEDKGLWRAEQVEQDWNGFWSCCDDDDYLINDEGQIVAREIGWGLRREVM